MPLNGSFIESQIVVEASAHSLDSIVRTELYWNDVLIDTRINLSGTNTHYSYSFSPGLFNPQNLLRFKSIDAAGHSAESAIILFKKT
jgi:hypothetical protein